MGGEDDLNASIAHIVLCCVAGHGLGHMHSKNFTHPGMHANFFIHGILGFLHYQSGRFNNDFKSAYTISTAATRYLALPCLMADLYRGDQGLSSIHLVSGLIPFAMALAGNDNQHLGNLVIACNIVSLCVYSQQRDRVWGYYTAGAGVLAYFCSSHAGKNITYPLFLALIDYCAYRIFHYVLTMPRLRKGGNLSRNTINSRRKQAKKRNKTNEAAIEPSSVENEMTDVKIPEQAESAPLPAISNYSILYCEAVLQS